MKSNKELIFEYLKDIREEVFRELDLDTNFTESCCPVCGSTQIEVRKVTNKSRK